MIESDQSHDSDLPVPPDAALNQHTGRAAFHQMCMEAMESGSKLTEADGDALVQRARYELKLDLSTIQSVLEEVKDRAVQRAILQAALRDAKQHAAHLAGVRDAFQAMQDAESAEWVGPVADRCFDLFKRWLPDLFNTMYPRRYQVPHGYVSPKHLIGPAARMVVQAVMRTEDAPIRSTAPLSPPSLGNDTYAAFAKLARLGVPTYFMDADVVTALQRTDLPDGFLMSDIQFPLDALLLMIPSGTVQVKGTDISMIVITRLTPGDGRMLIVDSLFGVGKVPPAIITQSPTSDASAGMAVVAITRAGDMITASGTLNNVPVKDAVRDSVMGPNAEELDVSVAALAIQIILTMGSEPAMLEPPCIAHAGKVKRGVKVRPDLWHPNYFGRKCRLSSKSGSGEHGTHQSPRGHWRRGHQRVYHVAVEMGVDGEDVGRPVAWTEDLRRRHIELVSIDYGTGTATVTGVDGRDSVPVAELRRLTRTCRWIKPVFINPGT